MKITDYTPPFRYDEKNETILDAEGYLLCEAGENAGPMITLALNNEAERGGSGEIFPDTNFINEWVSHAVVLLSSWHADGTGWSDWDTKVHNNMVQVQKMLYRPYRHTKIVCYCGSLRMAMEQFKKAEYEAVLKGEIALLPCCMFVDIQREYGAESDYKIKADETHKRKIDICDEVFVLNLGGYIGESTRSEIEYAQSIGKPIKYLESLQQPENTPSLSGNKKPDEIKPGNNQNLFEALQNVCSFTALQSDMIEIVEAVRKDQINPPLKDK